MCWEGKFVRRERVREIKSRRKHSKNTTNQFEWPSAIWTCCWVSLSGLSWKSLRSYDARLMRFAHLWSSFQLSQDLFKSQEHRQHWKGKSLVDCKVRLPRKIDFLNAFWHCRFSPELGKKTRKTFPSIDKDLFFTSLQVFFVENQEKRSI